MSEENDTAAAISETGWRLFATNGYANTTVEDVARELRTSKRRIYEHFESKEELLADGARRALASADRSVQAVLASARGPGEKLHALIREVVAQLGSIGPGLIRDLSRHAPAVWREINLRRDRMVRRHLAEALAGFSPGPIRFGISPERFADVVSAAVAGVMSRREQSENVLEAATDIRVLAELIRVGLSCTDEIEEVERD